MDLAALLNGFGTVLTPVNLLYAFIGAVVGTAVGVLPGLGPPAAIALLLPVTYYINSPVSAIIMTAGIYYGAMYGGSTTSILLNIPGEAASVVTTLDGYQMARQGRAGAALGVAAIGSFVAGTLGVLGLTVVAPAMSRLAMGFGPAEYFSLAVLGLVLAAYLSGRSPVKGLIMVVLGMLLASVGQDPISGELRLTFGSLHLQGGIDFVVVTMGMFGIGEILANLEQREAGTLVTRRLERILPSLQDLASSWWAIIRGSVIGFVTGVLPGGGAIIASLISYAVEKRVSRHPERFGKGAIEGVAGPESANNAASVSSFIPLLTLGIPGNAATAMLFAALLIQGVTPGPLMLRDRPDVFWGLIASMYLGNLMLLILNLPLVGVWVQLLRVPYAYLAPVVAVITLIGVYSVNYSVFDIWVMLAMGIAGYVLRKLDFEPGPFLLAFVLERTFEQSLRQALILGQGSPLIFVTRPISLALLGMAVLFMVTSFWSARRSPGTGQPSGAMPAEA